MFPGDLSSGIPIAIWAMLIGSCLGGVWIALATSLPPLATGIDSPTGAVLVLLSAATGAGVVAAGGSPQTAVQTVMLVFTAATFMSGALLYGLGACRWGSYFRFVPYFVVGGFLAATGWFLIAGGPATLFTLTRANFERMRRERPDLATAFDDFTLRILSNRVDFVSRAVVALSR